MNNNFPKLFMALFCLFALSFSAQAQTEYQVIFSTTDAASGSNGSKLEVFFNESSDPDEVMIIEAGDASDTLTICIGDCDDSTADLKGNNGSLLELRYWEGNGATASNRNVRVEGPYGIIEDYGTPISLQASGNDPIKLVELDQCALDSDNPEAAIWGGSAGDFAAGEINPKEDDQIISGPRYAGDDCKIDFAGAELLLPLPKKCANNVAEFPYVLSITSPDLTQEDTLFFTVQSDYSVDVTSTANDINIVAFAAAINAATTVDGRRIVVALPTVSSEQTWVDLGAVTVEGTYTSATGVESSLEKTLYFVPEGTNGTIVTNDAVRISLADCEYVADADDFLEGHDFLCDAEKDLYKVEIFDKYNRNLGDVITNEELNGTWDDGTPGDRDGCLTVSGDYSKDDCQKVHITYIPQGSLGWAVVCFEDKNAPVITADLDTTISCNDDLYEVLAKNDTAGMPAHLMLTAADVTDCSPVTVALVNTLVTDGCGKDGSDITTVGVITKTWEATDTKTGFKASYTQVINIEAPRFSEVVAPSDLKLGCEYADADLSPKALFDAGHREAAPTTPGAGIIGGEDEKDLCGYAYTYTDQELSACGDKGIKIIRSWSLLNWCTGARQEYVQSIEISDNQAPTITSITYDLGSEAKECAGEITLTVNATDDCSGVQSVIARYAATTSGIGGQTLNGTVNLTAGSGSMTGLPLNVDVNITVTATDACGSSIDSTFVVRTADESAPICVVDSRHNITVGSDGYAYAYADNIDEGSHDNCGLDRIEVCREDDTDENWGEYVRVGCNEDTVKVKFRAVDIYGNTCETWMTVVVENPIVPSIKDTTDHTISCLDVDAMSDADIADRNGDGEITQDDFFSVTSFCGVEFDYDVERNVYCGKGYVVVTATATNPSRKGGTVTYRDVIEVTPHNEFKVTFPADVEIDGCGAVATLDAPVIENRGCGQVIMTEKRDTLKAVGGGCLKVLRTFRVLDQCADRFTTTGATRVRDLGDRMFDVTGTYDAATGLCTVEPIEYVQTIIVNDDVAPTITVEAEDVCIDADNAACEGPISFVVNPSDDCATNLTVSYNVTNNATGASVGSDRNVSDRTITLNDLVETGSYTIVVTTTDNCGNDAQDTTTIVVSDCKKPTPVCYSQLNAPIMQIGDGGMVEIWASDFLKEAYDNCTDPAYLEAGVKFANPRLDQGIDFVEGSTELIVLDGVEDAGLRVSCLALTGNANVNVIVDVVVTDEAGNSNFCTASFLVQANEACGTAGVAASVAGAISTYAGKNVENVNVSISGDAVSEISTSTEGSFQFSNLEFGSTYEISAEKVDAVGNGVNTQDIVNIVSHILGKKEFDNPYQFIAADVNNDGRISASDLSEIRSIVLRTKSDFTNNNSWRFVDKAYNFTSDFPLGEDFNETVDIKSLSADDQANFYAVKVGDVNGTAVANSNEASSRNANVIRLGVQDAQLKAGNTYAVELTATQAQEILAYELTLNLSDAVSLVGTEAGKLNVNESNFGFNFINEGLITSSWNVTNNAVKVDASDVLFTVNLRANADATLSDVFAINSKLTEANVYTVDQAARLEVSFNDAAEKTALHQNTPNPFGDVTTISFELAKADAGVITVYDVAGKVVKSIAGDFVQGMNEVTLSKSDLNTTGVLYYQLETSDFSATKRMVVIK